MNGTGPAYSEGLTARFNISVALDAFLIGLSETNPDTFAMVQSPDVQDPDSLAWRYQYCTEFGTLPPLLDEDLFPDLVVCTYVGFFIGANPNNNQSIQSKFLSLQSIQQQCLESFPEGAVPSQPKVDALNKAYGGWFMNPTHVMFTNGEIDPWRTLSVSSFEENAPKRNGSLIVPA